MIGTFLCVRLGVVVVWSCYLVVTRSGMELIAIWARVWYQKTLRRDKAKLEKQKPKQRPEYWTR